MSASVNKVGENRLVAAQQGKQCQVAFAYDYMGRRVSKVTEDGSGTTECDYVYDGWALIRERIATGETAQTNSYVYGLDLSGGLQGAGTIGGILATVREGDSAPVVGFYAYDANGNVTDLVGTNGTGLAHYEYDPFGNPLVATGALAADNPFRFSTKYTDDETGLVYYGYRFYSPQLGRWLSRDPIEEEGGQNLYAIAGNNVIVRTDYLGLFGPMHPGRAGWLSEFEKKCRSCSWNAMQNALKRYPFTSGEPKMGHVNCMRHCLGSADVASKCGRACAFAAGHGYELKGGKYFSSDSRIDRRNNRKGRACADAADREECCKRVCPPCESTY